MINTQQKQILFIFVLFIMLFLLFLLYLDPIEPLANRLVPLVIQDDPQHLQGSHAPDIPLQEILKQRRAPAAHHDNTLGVRRGVEVT